MASQASSLRLKNLLVAGTLSAFVVGAYVYSMKAVGTTDLDRAVEKVEKEIAAERAAAKQNGNGSALSDVVATSRETNDDGTAQTSGFARVGGKTVLRNLSLNELEGWLQKHGHPARQAEHVWRWLYRDLAKDAFDVPGAPGMNKGFRQFLASHAEFDVLVVKEIKKAADGTTKVVLETKAGGRVETVLIPTPGRNTVCVSSQVGCAMNCQFCYTGRIGLKANLSTGEIVEQLVIMRRLFTADVGPINNVVFMGMGEPMHNLDNVIRAVDVMVHQQGLHVSHKKVSVSTSGLVPQIRHFCRTSPASLAVSLNATTDEVRDWIMPINRQYNLESLIGCLAGQFPRANGGQDKVLFEYVLLKGINDSLDDARRLIELVKPVPCRVNLIGFNPHAGSAFQPVPKPQMLEFFRVLADAGMVVTLRESRGDDQMAACGQLGELGSNPLQLLTPPARFQQALAGVPATIG
ncbi:ribosomal RNA large subunit methyltransferase [Klebsormidium nitens]|uniref:Ribosomal RNA large subunit methyltransferase n=1 Tax=Klebsormidium nitens TaxID=105231 RepID=A0A1Y1HYW5_KLENI|nr:ribosomal RNA large subunit methyltransferase [Klebsormidium nitens]|eukprot:GAQ82131.1 ribosomal RNA large subunit methyltransferase [Klebsormidium nitens]